MPVFVDHLLSTQPKKTSKAVLSASADSKFDSFSLAAFCRRASESRMRSASERVSALFSSANARSARVFSRASCFFASAAFFSFLASEKSGRGKTEISSLWAGT